MLFDKVCLGLCIVILGTTHFDNIHGAELQLNNYISRITRNRRQSESSDCGQISTPGSYPWHVAIYNSKNQYLCSGSILSDNVVLTVAHCITNYNGDIKSPDEISIAVGKKYRKYNDEKDVDAQYSKVNTIHVPETYRGLALSYGSDIGVLVLKTPLQLSDKVQPVCINFSPEFYNTSQLLNKVGIVTGWDFTEPNKQPSEKITELAIPFVPFAECYENSPKQFLPFLTLDKICGGYLNEGKSICGRGPSGAPLVFLDPSTDRYYVHGIASVSSVTSNGACDTNQYSAYTYISKHIDFIKNLL